MGVTSKAMASASLGNNAQDYARQRMAMVGRLRDRDGIRDERILDAMERIPRHLFVPEVLRAHAYGDHALPIAGGQTISQPYIVARETELLEVNNKDRVLEIGAGSGYQTAILAQVAGTVFAIERLAELARGAQKLLSALGIGNVIVKSFDGTRGWSEFAPYRGVLVAAGSPEVPQPLVNQLQVGGHLVIPIGTEKEQHLTRVTRTETGTTIENHGPCQFVKLIGQHGWEQ